MIVDYTIFRQIKGKTFVISFFLTSEYKTNPIKTNESTSIKYAIKIERTIIPNDVPNENTSMIIAEILAAKTIPYKKCHLFQMAFFNNYKTGLVNRNGL